MKKPVPRDPPASIDATAGITRLTTSSSDELGEGSATRAGGTGAGGWIVPDADTTAGMSASDRFEETAGAGASAIATGIAAGASTAAGAASLDRNGNIAATTTTTRPTASMVPRLDESAATSPTAAIASSTGTSPGEKPQRQTSTRRGTCRVQAGQVQAGRSDEGVSISSVGGSSIYRPIAARPSLSPQLQVGPQDGRPARVMLFVKGDLALSICESGRGGC